MREKMFAVGDDFWIEKVQGPPTKPHDDHRIEGEGTLEPGHFLACARVRAGESGWRSRVPSVATRPHHDHRIEGGGVPSSPGRS